MASNDTLTSHQMIRMVILSVGYIDKSFMQRNVCPPSLPCDTAGHGGGSRLGRRSGLEHGPVFPGESQVSPLAPIKSRPQIVNPVVKVYFSSICEGPQRPSTLLFSVPIPPLVPQTICWLCPCLTTRSTSRSL